MVESKVSGIYIIICIVNNKVYVGSAKDIHFRWFMHRNRLDRGRHHNRYLQSSWEKHGAESFNFQILEVVPDVSMLIDREQNWIDHYDASNSECGFNLSPTAGSSLGVKYSLESRMRMSEARRGCKLSTETRMKLSVVGKGKKHSPETVAKISAAHRGCTHSPEHVAKVAATKRGKKHSPESIAKMSEAHRGYRHSSESIAKMSASKSETQRKLSDSDAIEVWRRLGLGHKLIDIAADLGCSRGLISRIKVGKSVYNTGGLFSGSEGSNVDEPDWIPEEITF